MSRMAETPPKRAQMAENCKITSNFIVEVQHPHKVHFRWWSVHFHSLKECILHSEKCAKKCSKFTKKNLSVPYLKKNSWARVSWTHIHALVKIPASPQFRSCKSPKASMIAIEHPLGNSSHKAFGRRAVPNKMPKQTNIWASLFAFLEQTPLQLSETSQRHNAIVNHLKKLK